MTPYQVTYGWMVQILDLLTGGKEIKVCVSVSVTTFQAIFRAAAVLTVYGIKTNVFISNLMSVKEKVKCIISSVKIIHSTRKTF